MPFCDPVAGHSPRPATEKPAALHGTTPYFTPENPRRRAAELTVPPGWYRSGRAIFHRGVGSAPAHRCDCGRWIRWQRTGRLWLASCWTDSAIVWPSRGGRRGCGSSMRRARQGAFDLDLDDGPEGLLGWEASDDCLGVGVVATGRVTMDEGRGEGGGGGGDGAVRAAGTGRVRAIGTGRVRAAGTGPGIGPAGLRSGTTPGVRLACLVSRDGAVGWRMVVPGRGEPGRTPHGGAAARLPPAVLRAANASPTGGRRPGPAGGLVVDCPRHHPPHRPPAVLAGGGGAPPGRGSPGRARAPPPRRRER